jgi:hypothetical protein
VITVRGHQPSREDRQKGSNCERNWSLTCLQQRLEKASGRMIKHARYYWLLLAESHLTRRLFGGMLARIAALPSPAG